MLIAARHIWSGGELQHGQALALEGRTRQLRPLGGATPDLSVNLITPTLTDLQVNGGGGVLFNTSPNPDGLDAIATAHGRLGTGAILPTIITDAPEVLEAGAGAVIARRDDPRILGLHIEGPHISKQKRGTHDARFIRPLDARTFDVIDRLRAHDIAVMITLAPEQATSDDLKALAARGVVVSLGHSAATARDAEQALVDGAACFTHLYNAMEPMTSRAPGLLGVALTADCPAGIIADGHHVDWRMLQIAVRARPGPTFAVSDAMPSVGGPDRFELYGQTVTLKDGKLVNAEGSLAGAHIDMATSLANLVRHAALPLAQACAMCTDIPRSVLGLPSQSVEEPGQSILLFDDAWQRMEAPTV
ncbi:MAG: N-acetylglucosamine-6-phosphate deacetylase [Paracoccaceae bacterium]|nr:N-acetylglucosamine-6-phosphate deacetylase [Paracoccaceae bacterium]